MDWLKEVAEKAVEGDRSVSYNSAAQNADLLNNVDRFGGWDQMTSLACICSEGQIEAYNSSLKGDEEQLTRERFTRAIQENKIPEFQNPPRAWLNPDNVRLGINRRHPYHWLDGDAVVKGVKMFRRYIHDVFLKMHSNPLGRKVLFFAWWIVNASSKKDQEVQQLHVVFRQEPKVINMVIGAVTE